VSRCVKTVIAALGLTASLAAPAFAQATTCAGTNIMTELKASEPKLYAEIRQAADVTLNAKSVLWKIENTEKPEQAPSYLFGTIHLTDDRVMELPEAVKTAFSESVRAALEIEDVSSSRISEALQTMSSRGSVLLPAKERLEAMLTPAELKEATKVLVRTGLDAKVLGRVRPWVALVMLGTPDCERSRLMGGKVTLDESIAIQAENRGMGTFGLEQLEQQFQSMAAIPDADQLALLKAQLAYANRLTDVVETTLQLYLDRDLGAIWPLQIALAKKAGVDPKVFDSYEENLLSVRNNRMYGRLSAHLDRGGVFVAVGALHLPGKTGLVQQAIDAGFKVTPVE
jgi:uncharacterized protein